MFIIDSLSFVLHEIICSYFWMIEYARVVFVRNLYGDMVIRVDAIKIYVYYTTFLMT